MTYDHVSCKELTNLGVERDLTYYAIRQKPDGILLNGPSSAGNPPSQRRCGKSFKNVGMTPSSSHWMIICKCQ